MKKYLGLLYYKLITYKKQFNYFILPNIFSKVDYSYSTLPNCNQRTEITGLGKVTIGANCMFGYKPGGFWRKGNIEFQVRYKNAEIIIGNKVGTNNNIFLCAANKISIGDNTLIGQGTVIMDFEAHGMAINERNKLGEIGTVEIGKNVWIGNNVTILKNSKIGDNTIVAAGAIVSGDFPSDVIIGGVPAKIIKPL
jgi:acetyltransferase-like isoleucine patch superfamily enzyme